MFCSGCEKEVARSDKFCKHCSHPLDGNLRPSAAVQTGDHSVVIGGGNRSMTEVVYGDKFVSVPKLKVVRLTAEFDWRTRIRSLWSLILGATGLIASLITIASFPFEVIPRILNVEDAPGFLYCLTIASFLLLGFGFHMKRHKFMSLYFFALKEDSEGRLHVTAPLRGDCPDCEGTLFLRNVGTVETKGLKSVCSHRPDRHIYEWDDE